MSLHIKSIIAKAASADANGNGVLSHQEITADAAKAKVQNDTARYNLMTGLANHLAQLDLHQKTPGDSVQISARTWVSDEGAKQTRRSQDNKVIENQMLNAMAQRQQPHVLGNTPSAFQQAQISPILALLWKTRLRNLTQKS